MHSTTILAMASMAACALAIPYPPEATVNPGVPAGKHASFGNKKGNFQPTKPITSTPVNKTRHAARDTGEWVQISVDAVWTINDYDGIGDGVDQYTMYWGDGSAGDGWPTRDQWVSFDNMFNNNKGLMFSSCDQYNVGDDSGPEVGAIWNAIEQVAATTGVDHRFILAIILQESGGCVRVPTSNYGVRNPGLMQDHNGYYTCNSDLTDEIDYPCSQDTITGMVSEGTAGTDDGDGLANCINESNWWTDADFYRAARIYNSGSVEDNNQLEDGVATHCYASDVANRLTGWVWAESQCYCDSDPASCGISCANDPGMC